MCVLYVCLYSMRLWYERASAVWNQCSQPLWPRPYREERQDPPDRQRREGGHLCHRWGAVMDYWKFGLKQKTGLHRYRRIFLSALSIIVLSLQSGRLVTWCPWIQMACQTRMLNWNWFQTQRATANRRPRPSAQRSIPSGMRVSPCEYMWTWKMKRGL